ncbi:MAG: N-acetylmuramic acid 6-phosphate etherase [Tissierellia bacterium]|nr:N-acetylmuramic acid 6-phosphate etherase [Tissierellia bacterium]
MKETEKRNINSENLDEMTTTEILRVINNEDKKVAMAISNSIEDITKAVNIVVDALKKGNRVFYIGAGTSGRLGVLDASELVPTYGVDENLFCAIIAGGDIALRKAVENAEDDIEKVKEDLNDRDYKKGDVLIGIAASGQTPYVVSGLQYAKNMGSPTISISMNENSAISQFADCPIEINVGAEVITGSTRMKAGTCQKLVLNMISTAAMVRMGKVYDNYMVDLIATNRKLKDRSVRIVKDITGCDDLTAKVTLDEANGNVKVSIVALILDIDVKEAKKRLDQNDGYVRRVINNG